jgi:hypothetical protein
MTRAEASLQSYHRHSDKINASRRANRKHITYEVRPCENCGKPYQPIRSTSQFCQRKVCVNERQRLNRNVRLGR